MSVDYERKNFELDPDTRTIDASFSLVNRSREDWRKADGFAIGWQIYDAETAMFVAEGEWVSLNEDLLSAQTRDVSISIQLPPERGHYHVYLSPILPPGGWLYARNEPFILIDADVAQGKAELREASIVTLRQLRRRKLWNRIGMVFTAPFTSIWRNRSLIASLSRRDVLSRYRGSVGDIVWTVLNPLLLMATYFFVFGIVLRRADQSPTEFAFYFLAGMLPWLAFSEAIGRAPSGILENRVLVKKVVFPVEILPVTQVISGVVTQLFAAALLLLAMLIVLGSIPPTVAWLPVLLVPQVLFTLGVAWLLSATGVYLRDIGQMIGFVLTLWFFLTPICYYEASLPAWAHGVLTKNPIYVLVRGYRATLLYGQAPAMGALVKLWVVASLVFLLGYAWFYKLRKGFADVI